MPGRNDWIEQKVYNPSSPSPMSASFSRIDARSPSTTLGRCGSFVCAREEHVERSYPTLGHIVNNKVNLWNLEMVERQAEPTLPTESTSHRHPMVARYGRDERRTGSASSPSFTEKSSRNRPLLWASGPVSGLASLVPNAAAISDTPHTLSAGRRARQRTALEESGSTTHIIAD